MFQVASHNLQANFTSQHISECSTKHLLRNVQNATSYVLFWFYCCCNIIFSHLFTWSPIHFSQSFWSMPLFNSVSGIKEPQDSSNCIITWAQSIWSRASCQIFTLNHILHTVATSVTSPNYTKVDLFLIIKPTRCTNYSNLFLKWNSTCFGQFLSPSSEIFHYAHSNGVCHTGLLTGCTLFTK